MNNFDINKKFEHFRNLSYPKGDKKVRFFLQGSCNAQNITFKTSIGLYSITKGIYKIYLLERE